ncbi:unnamed protein product [Oikopleura dioica]|uniref:Uncharacterized protein n=1 Tax=Oikopleura dioica TaxID=34765 RepID=E4X0G7_OIKDI|nr:unnamed protein product [Oikopleura dioica]
MFHLWCHFVRQSVSETEKRFLKKRKKKQASIIGESSGCKVTICDRNSRVQRRQGSGPELKTVQKLTD